MSCFAPQWAAGRNFLFSAAGRACKLVDMKVEEYKPVVRAEVFEEETFLNLTLSKKLRDDGTPWVRVSVRPVLVRGRRELQFSYFDAKKHVSRNYSGGEAAARLDEALEMPFGQVHVQSAAGDLQVLVSRKGQVHMTRSRTSAFSSLTTNRFGPGGQELCLSQFGARASAIASCYDRR